MEAEERLRGLLLELEGLSKNPPKGMLDWISVIENIFEMLHLCKDRYKSNHDEYYKVVSGLIGNFYSQCGNLRLSLRRDREES